MQHRKCIFGSFFFLREYFCFVQAVLRLLGSRDHHTPTSKQLGLHVHITVPSQFSVIMAISFFFKFYFYYFVIVCTHEHINTDV